MVALSEVNDAHDAITLLAHSICVIDEYLGNHPNNDFQGWRNAKRDPVRIAIEGDRKGFPPIIEARSRVRNMWGYDVAKAFTRESPVVVDGCHGTSLHDVLYLVASGVVCDLVKASRQNEAEFIGLELQRNFREDVTSLLGNDNELVRSFNGGTDATVITISFDKIIELGQPIKFRGLSFTEINAGLECELEVVARRIEASTGEWSKVMTKEVAASMYGFSAKTLTRRIDAGEINVKKVGGLIQIPMNQIPGQ